MVIRQCPCKIFRHVLSQATVMKIYTMKVAPVDQERTSDYFISTVTYRSSEQVQEVQLKKWNIQIYK
jgi:hypothetical protein